LILFQLICDAIIVFFQALIGGLSILALLTALSACHSLISNYMYTRRSKNY